MVGRRRVPLKRCFGDFHSGNPRRRRATDPAGPIILAAGVHGYHEIATHLRHSSNCAGTREEYLCKHPLQPRLFEKA
jgi:hypothetical protein